MGKDSLDLLKQLVAYTPGQQNIFLLKQKNTLNETEKKALISSVIQQQQIYRRNREASAKSLVLELSKGTKLSLSDRPTRDKLSNQVKEVLKNWWNERYWQLMRLQIEVAFFDKPTQECISGVLQSIQAYRPLLEQLAQSQNPQVQGQSKAIINSFRLPTTWTANSISQMFTVHQKVGNLHNEVLNALAKGDAETWRQAIGWGQMQAQEYILRKQFRQLQNQPMQNMAAYLAKKENRLHKDQTRNLITYIQKRQNTYKSLQAQCSDQIKEKILRRQTDGLAALIQQYNTLSVALNRWELVTVLLAAQNCRELLPQRVSALIATYDTSLKELAENAKWDGIAPLVSTFIEKAQKELQEEERKVKKSEPASWSEMVDLYVRIKGMRSQMSASMKTEEQLSKFIDWKQRGNNNDKGFTVNKLSLKDNSEGLHERHGVYAVAQAVQIESPFSVAQGIYCQQPGNSVTSSK